MSAPVVSLKPIPDSSVFRPKRPKKPYAPQVLIPFMIVRDRDQV